MRRLGYFPSVTDRRKDEQRAAGAGISGEACYRLLARSDAVQRARFSLQTGAYAEHRSGHKELSLSVKWRWFAFMRSRFDGWLFAEIVDGGYWAASSVAVATGFDRRFSSATGGVGLGCSEG